MIENKKCVYYIYYPYYYHQHHHWYFVRKQHIEINNTHTVLSYCCLSDNEVAK